MTSAVVIGATGEVGGHILQNLLDKYSYQTIYVLGRESILRIPDHAKVRKIVVDFDNLEFDTSILQGADVFAALGTGERADFEKIDYGYTYNFSKLCHGKVKSFNLVSAMGANSQTSYKYLQVKGQLEDDLLKLDLGVQRFYRPSMLLAPERKDLEWSEAAWIKIFQIISPILVGPIAGWKGIAPEQVANSMVQNAIAGNSQQVYLYKDMV